MNIPIQWPRIARLILSACTVISAIAILGVMFHTLIAVIARAVFDITLQGTQDYVSYWWMVPAVSFAIIGAYGGREHMEVGMLTENLSTRGQHIIGWVAAAVTLVYIALTAGYSMDEFIQQMIKGEYSGATGVLLWPARAVIPLAAGLLAVLIVWSFFLKSTPGAVSGAQDSTVGGEGNE